MTATASASAEAEQPSELEVTHPIFGSLRTKGYRTGDIILIVVLIISMSALVAIYHHHAEAKDSDKTVAQALKDSQKDIAAALKESNAQSTEALKQMAAEQQKATRVLQQMSCLLDPAMKARPDAMEVCRRLTERAR